MKKIIAPLLFIFITVHVYAQTVPEKIDSLIMANVKEGKFNGVVFMAQKGNVLFEKGYGYKNWDRKINNDPNTIFQIGSITKQITAAVILQLQQEKKLSVTDKLSKYFPDFPNGDKITIEHLLTHSSGIYNYTNDTTLMKSDVTKPRTEIEMIATFKNIPLGFEPGSAMSYSNSGYSLLGYIIERVTGKPNEKVIRERILQPLGMTSSGFDFTHLQNSNKANGYFSLTAGSANPAPVVDSTIAYSAGAMYSTAGDLYKWERAIYTNKILTPESWKATFTPYKKKYGYGWNIDTMYNKLLTAHSGGIHGFSSFLVRFPQDELAIILLSNASSPGLSKLAKNIAAIAFNQPFEMPAPNKEVLIDSSLLQQYVGEYKLAPTFSIIITANGSQLTAQATGQPAAEIYPQKENVFFYKVVDAQIEFEKDNNGKVKSLTLHQSGVKMKGEKTEQ